MKKRAGKQSLAKAVMLYCVIGVLVVALGVGNYFAMIYSSLITIYLGQNEETNKTALDDSAVYFASEYDSGEKLQADEKALAMEIQTQGTTLLANENATLPLAVGSKVTVLGMRSVNSVYQDSGSASGERYKCSTIYDSLREAGFQVNEATEAFYGSDVCKNYKLKAEGANASMNEGIADIREVPVSLYTNDVITSFSDYNDAAILMISRTGGEGHDLDIAGRYLELSQEERDVIDLAADNFDRVIVLLNTSHPVSVGYLEGKADAVVWMGVPGDYGMDVMGEILSGARIPSGKLVDTFAYSSVSAPAVKNFGVDTTFQNWDKKSVVYQEGIYVGYRYYETRYADCVAGKGNASSSVGSIDGEEWNYSKEVQYPFGYGLSYTTFDVALNADYTQNDVDFVFTGTVTNTGSVDGMETVELYIQKPYTQYDIDNGVEKSAIELAGYTKIAVAAGETADFTITVPKETLKSYDGNNAKTYIVDEGDYWFAVGNGSHEALNNILAAQGYTTEDGMDAQGNSANAVVYQQDTFDDTTFAVSLATGAEITNQLQLAELKNYVNDFTYLTRNDWEGTFPTELYIITATDEMKADAEYNFEEDPNAQMPTFGTVTAAHELSLIELRGKAYDDPMWDDLLNQMEAKTMFSLISTCGFKTNAIKSISKPQTREQDGPYGITGALIGTDIVSTIYPGGDTRAATYNDALIERMGQLVGEDALAAKINGWYAPGCNLHRSAYGGRSAEYYSEDPLLSGKMTAATCRGANSKGLITFTKHFALNNQETNRGGIMTFANEQTIRELYLKAFELAVREGQTHAIMSSYNNVGLKWSSGIYGLQTTILRDEWGFDGFVLTDLGGGTGMILDGLANGTDAWLSTNVQDAGKVFPGYSKSATKLNLLRQATKRILYAYVNYSSCMNGYIVATEVETSLPTWQIALYILDATAAVGAILGVVLVTKKVLPKKTGTCEITSD